MGKRKACMMLQHLLMSKQERIARDYIILKANNSKQRRQISNSVSKRLMQDGLAAQNNGDYSEALDYYNESLLLEENKIDRGETLKNMAIIYMSNGEEDRSI